VKQTISIAVDEFSTPVLVSSSKDETVGDIINKMKENNVRHIPVLDNSRPIGIISDRDIHLLNDIGKEELRLLKASDIMVSEPYCVNLGTPLDEVAFKMSERKIGSALIVNKDGDLDSIFTSVDGLNALIEIIRGEVE
tara:strand:+ start:489 stop:902 length:414 start_codon:yes stop_codon:yes gene_type:complete